MNKSIFNMNAIRAARCPKRRGCIKCGYFLQEFTAGAQEYNVLFREALVVDTDIR